MLPSSPHEGVYGVPGKAYANSQSHIKIPTGIGFRIMSTFSLRPYDSLPAIYRTKGELDFWNIL
jgi:hypothetical protein